MLDVNFIMKIEYIINRLKEKGYDGPLSIEREISGEQQRADILSSIDYLNNIIGGLQNEA